jgi:enoyl-CoA hydratase/carnithine racemase
VIALASEFRLATPAARTAFLIVRVGLAGCDMGACALLPRLIGQGRATELLYTGRASDAAEGERIGFYNRVVPDAELAAAAAQLASELARGPTLAHALTEKMLRLEWNLGVNEAIDAEARAGAPHEERGFPPRLRGIRREEEAGLRGGLMDSHAERLDWPFFGEEHRRLAVGVAAEGRQIFVAGLLEPGAKVEFEATAAI